MQETTIEKSIVAQAVVPHFLYKIITKSDWQQSKATVCTPASDDAFIHFSTPSQFPIVRARKFAGIEHVVLRIDTTKVVGSWKLEWDSKHIDQYWHLYDGYIPTIAVAEIE